MLRRLHKGASTGGSTTQAGSLPGMCELISLEDFLSSRHSRAGEHFSAVLRVRNVSDFSIQLCWRAASRAGSSFCSRVSRICKRFIA